MSHTYGAYATPPLSDALPGATLGEAFTRFWQKYATFSGRASRSEYWWMYLVSVIVGLITSGVDLAVSGGVQLAQETTFSVGDIFGYLWTVAALVPGLALAVRRLHDTNHSGWWLLIALVPLVGAIVLLVFVLTGPDPAGARFD